MHTNYKTFLTGAVICGVLLFPGCSGPGAGGDTWSVLIGALPSEIKVRNASETPSFYILKQTHEPLFRQVDGEKYVSRLLKGWRRNLMSTEYTFCPDISARFNSEKSFSVRFLGGYLSKLMEIYDATAQIRTRGACVEVCFQKPKPGLLEFLARYENAPKIPAPPIGEIGLGPFRVEEIGADRVVLTRKEKVSDGYNRIVLYKYAGENDPRLEDRRISDFNQLSDFQQPGWIKEEYSMFGNVELRVAGLAINSADSQLREALYNCIDIEEFRRAFLPEKKKFLPVASILPVGVYGGVAGKPEQSCSQARKKYLRGKKIILANPYVGNRGALRGFSEEFLKEFGAEFFVKNYEPADLLGELYDHSRKKSYTLLVIVSDTFRPAHRPFLEYYLGPDSAVDYVPREMREMYGRILSEDAHSARAELAKSLSHLVEKHFIALPLYQGGGELFYPRQIKNLEVGRGFSEYPEVAEFRW